MHKQPETKPWLSAGRVTVMVQLVLVAATLVGIGIGARLATAAAPPTLDISQVPLQLVTPVHPQVLLAIGNSESMDGNLSGAIMVGSGSLGAGLSTLNSSSSPINYTVPAGFTPPVTPADGSGNAPYTATVSGNLVDNGDSRLNVAKAGVSAILSAYMQNTDFALFDYHTGAPTRYTTWVYYMSAAGGFTFANAPIARVGSAPYTVANPCFGYITTTSVAVQNNCATMVPTLYTAADLDANAYMIVNSSSDDADVNDVLYAPSGFQPVSVAYGGPTPSGNTLAGFNAGSVRSTYDSTLPAGQVNQTAPTNAGYVPASPQVMYARRGFGYGATQTPNAGNQVVPMTTAGVVPTAASVNAAIAAFTPALQPETNSTATTEIKASAGQAALAGLLTQANTYLATTKGTGACPPQQYVVLISDGLPTMDLAGSAWPPLGSAAATTYGVNASFDPTDGSLTSTNDQALTDTITTLAALKTAGINTYIIGLGAGVDPSLNPEAAKTLKAMAMAGGTGVAYPATSPAALVTALDSILISIQAGSLSTSQSAVNSTILKTGSVQYQASFTANDTPYQDWTGDLRKTTLDATTGLPTGAALWSAQALLDTQAAGSGWSSKRAITTWNPTLNSGAGGGAPFRTANLSTAQAALLGTTSTLQQTTLDYLRGDPSQEKRNGGALRNRSHLLGDIVNSTAKYVGPAEGLYFSSSYFSFVTAQKARAGMLYVGANDGMLHAFQASTGKEQFAFVPNAMFTKLGQLAAPLYNQGHQFFVDGSPQSGDVQFSDTTWHTLLVGGQNAGGKSIYALDITDPATLTTEAAVSSAVLWEFTDADMGLSYSAPQIAPVNATSKFAVFFGNGYNSTSQKPVLYAVNPQTGAKLASIDLCAAVSTACNSALSNGLSSVSIGYHDGLESNSASQVYAGDLQGNLWAVDISNASPAAWTVRLLLQARDSGGNPQAITTKPVVTLNPNYPGKAGNFVMIGTGQFLNVADLTNTQTQTAYGVWDKGGTTAAIRTSLQAQTLTVVLKATSGLPQDILTDTSTAVDYATKFGWYADLPSAGKRFMTNPTLLNGNFVATLNTPPATACSAQPQAMLLELNYANGGAPSHPILDVNGDGAFTSADQYGGGNPVGIAIGQGYASAPTILYPPNGPVHKNITLSSGAQKSVINKSGQKNVTSWWQIQ